MMIYKVFRVQEWRAAKGSAFFFGSPDDLRDGFIHFSSAHQVRATCDRHFATEHDLILAAVDPAALADLRWDVSRGGEKFPHLYAPLPLAVLETLTDIRRGPDGAFIFPPGIP
jgi:uncharacterized protein (DUF952 family)